MAQLFAYIAHKDGVAEDTALELLTAARKIDAAAPVTAIVVGSGEPVKAVAQAMAAAYGEVWTFDSPALAYPNAEMTRRLLASVLPAGACLLMAHDTFGMDLAPGLSIKLDAALVSDAVGITGLEGDALGLVRQEYGGQVNARVQAAIAGGCVITVRPGAYPPDEAAGAGRIVDRSGDIGDLAARRTFVELAPEEAGDIDITKADVLVSVGRGIESEDNLDIVRELAEALGGELSCSRPIVDARWLERARQVGTSGQTVKPKVYMACGISGSFQHLGGIKGKPFFVAINTNPAAPIFQAADVGIVADILDFIPALTEAVQTAK